MRLKDEKIIDRYDPFDDYDGPLADDFEPDEQYERWLEMKAKDFEKEFFGEDSDPLIF